MKLDTAEAIKDAEVDLEYFNMKLIRGLRAGDDIDKIRIQRKLLDDAITIYHLHRPPSIDNKYHQIPQSLLVQTFMRELQDGMDRRRP